MAQRSLPKLAASTSQDDYFNIQSVEYLFKGERKLLCGLIARTTFDIEHYLILPPIKRQPHIYTTAKSAFDYIHGLDLYQDLRDSPMSFETIMDILFRTENTIYTKLIRRQYPVLPLPFTEDPREPPKLRDRYKLQLILND